MVDPQDVSVARLDVGLTGGIGSGKSAVGRLLVGHGAVLVDSDALAREVVEPGTNGLDAVVEAFGRGVLTDDGRLDRPALAKVVFADPEALATLNGIVHPLVRRRSAELVAAAPPGAVVVHDIPLLAENGLAPGFHLVVVVRTPVDQRVARVTASRPMGEQDVRDRIAAQASDEQRAAVADVVLDNGGTPEDLASAVDAVWTGRLAPYAANLRAGRPASRIGSVGPGDAGRVQARLAARLGLESVVSAPDLVTVDGPTPRAEVLASAGWFAAGESGGLHDTADPGCGVRLQFLRPPP